MRAHPRPLRLLLQPLPRGMTNRSPKRCVVHLRAYCTYSIPEVLRSCQVHHAGCQENRSARVSCVGKWGAFWKLPIPVVWSRALAVGRRQPSLRACSGVCSQTQSTRWRDRGVQAHVSEPPMLWSLCTAARQGQTDCGMGRRLTARDRPLIPTCAVSSSGPSSASFGTCAVLSSYGVS